MSVRLYVGNLPKEVIEKDALQTLFADESNGISTKIIKDRKTGKCRGFAFVTVPTDEAADQFIEKFNGQSFMETELKIEKALPREKTKGNDEKETEEGEVKSPVASGVGGKRPKSKQQRSNNKKSGGSGYQQSDSAQPDPRWADQLAQLKEMLQATNS